MHEIISHELTEKFREYLDAEMDWRKKAGEGKLMMSRIDYTALTRLFSCTAKNEAAFEGLKSSGDKDIAHSVDFILNAVNVDDFSGLQEWAAKMENLAGLLVKLQREGKSSLTDEEFSRVLKLKREGRITLLTVMYLFCEMCGDDFELKSILSEYVAILKPEKTRHLYKMLLLTLAPIQTDSEDDSKQEDSAQNQNHEDSPEISRLKEQINILKAELEGAYIRLNSSEENYDLLQKEGKEAAINEVLSLMNSKESGMLIDQFAKCEKAMKDLSAKGINLPQEYSSLSLCVRIFMRTMRNIFGVSPVLKSGEIIEMTLDQAERYIYTGSDFRDSEEVKKAEVTSPGWKRNGEIFSLPQVMECR